jgi:hypothetical protein
MKIHPAKANIKVQGPLMENSQVLQDIFSAGVLEPVDWSTTANPQGRRLTCPVRNQQQCGNCWALSSTDALTDRYIVQSAIAGKKVGSQSLKLQPAITTQCTTQTVDQGCNGGAPYYAGQYFEQVGCPNISGNEPTWSAICSDGCSDIRQKCADLNSTFSGNTRWKAKSGSTVATLSAGNPDRKSVDTGTTILNIKRALMNGPVVGQMFCPNDFMYDGDTCQVWSKTGGVYINGSYNDELDRQYSDQNPTVHGPAWADIQMEGGSPSAHAVEIVGWGNEGNHGPYWIVKNTWGDSWNGDGFFKYGMYPNNKYLGLDVPVANAIQASTGKVLVAEGTDIGDFYGSCVSFDPDGLLENDGNFETYGDDSVAPRNAPMSRRKKILLLLLAMFIVLGLLYYFRKKL